MVTEDAKWFYDKVKITDKTFSEGWLQNFQEPAAERDTLMECSSDLVVQPKYRSSKKYIPVRTSVNVGNVRLKFKPEQATKAHRGSRGTVPLFL